MLTRRRRVAKWTTVGTSWVLLFGAAIGLSAPRAAAAEIEAAVQINFSGWAVVSSHAGALSSTQTYSWEETWFVNLVFAGDRWVQTGNGLRFLSGYGVRTRTGELSSCSAVLNSTPEGSETVGSPYGSRVWFSWDHGLYPDPGNDNVLVTGAAPWTLTVAQPAGGDSSLCNGPLDLPVLPSQFSKTLMCVLKQTAPERGVKLVTCQDQESIPTMTYGGNGSTTVTSGGQSLDADSIVSHYPAFLPEVPTWIEPFIPPPLPLWLWPPYHSPPTSYTPRIPTRSPTSGTETGQVNIAKQPLVKVRAKVTKGAPITFSLLWSSTGLAVARAIRKPTPVNVTLTFTPSRGKSVTTSTTSVLVPAPSSSPTSSSAASITSVEALGTPSDPSFVVRGSHLGSEPTPNPSAHPSGVGGCPSISGDNGYDYGTSFYIDNLSHNWSAGRYRPQLNETDCIDLVVTKFTSSEVVFHFGPFFAAHSSGFPLANGDQFEAVINGATRTVHLKFGTAATS